MSDSTSRPRSIGTIALVVLTCILLFVSVLAVWMRALVLNTDSYIRAVGPIIENPAVRDEVARDVVDAFYERVDVARALRDALPKRAKVIAPTLAQGVRDTAIQLASAALATKAVQKVWVQVNSVAHEQVVHILKGEGNVVTTDKGEVAVDLGPIAAQVRRALDDHGVTLFDAVPASEIDRRFVLFRSADLARAQQATKLLDTLGTWLPVATLLAGLGAIACSQHRRRTTGHLCLALAASLVVLMIGVAVGRAFYLDHIGSSVPRAVAAAPFDGLVRSLRFWVRLLIAVAVVGWFVTWFAGSREVKAREREMRVALGDVARRHDRVLVGAGLVVAAFTLVVAKQLTPRTVVVVALVLGLWELAVFLLAREPAAPA